MDYKDLAQRVRTKYPGAYDDLDDASLARKIVDKNPAYSDTTFEPEKGLPQRTSEKLTGFFKGMFGKPAITAATAPISKPLEEGGKVVAANPEGALEALPAIAGTAAGIATFGAGAIPAALAAGGGGFLGELAKQEARKRALNINPVSPNQPTIPFTSKKIPDIPGIPQRLSRAVIEAGMQAGPELVGRGVSKVFSKGGNVAEKAGIGAVRRAEGFQKSQLSSSKSWIESLRKMGQANRAAEETLKRGDVPLSGGSGEFLIKAQKLLSEGSSKVKTALKESVKSGSSVAEGTMDDALFRGLNPSNADELATAEKIRQELSDVMTGGKLNADDLLKLRSSWGKRGFSDTTVGSAASDMYRKAWGVAGDELKGLLGASSPKLKAMFVEGMRQEEMANTSLRGITNRIAGEEGNAFFSIPGMTTGIQKRAMAPLGVGLYQGGKLAKEAAKPVGFLSSISTRSKESKEKSEKLPPKRDTPPKLRNSLFGPSNASASTDIPEIEQSYDPKTEDGKLYAKAVSSLMLGDYKKTENLAYSAYLKNKNNKGAKRLLERLSEKKGSGYTVETIVKRK